MEHEIARRRISRILDHVAGPGEVSPPNPHLFPMNCSSTLSTIIPRCDNRLLFARQGSVSQGYFMQQVSTRQNFGPGISSQQNSCPAKGESSCQPFRKPMFSRPVQTESTLSISRDNYSVKQDLTLSSNDHPKFARPGSGKIKKPQLLCSRTRQTSISNGMEWSPRMDVAESGANYVVTVELPGVNLIDMRVEVDNQSLTIIGKRSTQQHRMPNCAGNSNPVYHQREILQGPFRVVWPLPIDVNKDSVSAEFVDGFLQITLPRLCER
ncbi:18.8 kDa class II heat shock protein isoform X1 [Elaeis guineensis]|uniref:18.8 kDa class II heat shock protein isoform X1 n=1 Tax=Elaeis guineensis var. tenera TaxID=51953 RepID=UPI003C6CF0B4